MKSTERLIIYPVLALLLIFTAIRFFKPLPDQAVFKNLSIVDSEGHAKINLSSWNGGGRIRLFGPTGNVRVKLSTPGDGGMVELFRSIGRRAVWMRANNSGGLVRVFGWEGKDGVILNGSNKGGAITISTNKGEPRVKFLVDETDRGKAEFLSAGGKHVKVMTP